MRLPAVIKYEEPEEEEAQMGFLLSLLMIPFIILMIAVFGSGNGGGCFYGDVFYEVYFEVTSLVKTGYLSALNF